LNGLQQLLVVRTNDPLSPPYCALLAASHLCGLQVDEDPQLSLPVLVDLQQLLAVRITDIQELSLTAAQYKAQQKKPRQWKAGTVISADNDAADDSQAGAASSSGASWGQALWQQLQTQSSCQPAKASPALHDREGGGHVQQQQQHARRLQRHHHQQQQQQQSGPYNIWDHKSGDIGSIVELFPQEIRTWMVTVEHV
jgi:hypothetical protein